MALIELIYLIFEFFDQRIAEAPAFLYIIDKKLNSPFLNQSNLIKNEMHKECCPRCFPTTEECTTFQASFKKLDA